MCSAHSGEITFENSGQTAVYHPKNERARDEALELQGTASYLTENNSQDMVSLSNDTKHVSFGVMGTTYDSSENYVQYSDESKKEELRPKLTEAEKAINQKNVLEALQTKDVDHVKELLARRELISPDGSPYVYYKVATRQGVEYIVLFTEEQHNQGLAAGAVGVVAVASLGGAAVLATCTVEQLAVGATAYTTRLVTAPDFANDVTTFEASMADGDKVGMFIDGISLAIPYSVGGAGTAKNITEDTLEAVVKDSTSYLDDAVDVVKKGDEVIEETAEEVVEKGSKEIIETIDDFKWAMFEDLPQVTIMVNGKERVYAKIGDSLFSVHALERMAPPTEEVIEELTKKYNKIALENGLEIGTKQYNVFMKKILIRVIFRLQL